MAIQKLDTIHYVPVSAQSWVRDLPHGCRLDSSRFEQACWGASSLELHRHAFTHSPPMLRICVPYQIVKLWRNESVAILKIGPGPMFKKNQHQKGHVFLTLTNSFSNWVAKNTPLWTGSWALAWGTFSNSVWKYTLLSTKSETGCVFKLVTDAFFSKFHYLIMDASYHQCFHLCPQLALGNYNTFQGVGRFGRIPQFMWKLRSISNVVY